MCPCVIADVVAAVPRYTDNSYTGRITVYTPPSVTALLDIDARGMQVCTHHRVNIHVHVGTYVHGCERCTCNCRLIFPPYLHNIIAGKFREVPFFFTESQPSKYLGDYFRGRTSPELLHPHLLVNRARTLICIYSIVKELGRVITQLKLTSSDVFVVL